MHPSPAVVERICSLGLWAVCRLRRTCYGLRLGSYRGCCSGRPKRPLPWLWPVGNGATLIVGNRPTRPRTLQDHRPPSSASRVHVHRHAVPRGTELVCAHVNIRSVANKLDDLLDVRHDLAIDVLFLIETWHDTDSVSFRRLRADGFQVVDRPRPRVRDDVIITNHGGVAAVAVPGVRLTRLDVGSQCEFLCVRVTSVLSSCIAIVVYRTGPVTLVFFTELSDVLDRVSTFTDPTVVVGDINIHLDRPEDLASRQFTNILAAHGLACGLLDIVATREDLPPPPVEVVDVGLSDH